MLKDILKCVPDTSSWDVYNKWAGDHMKPKKINNKQLKEEIESGNNYIQVGNQKYLLMEVNEVYKCDSYQVTNTEEEEKLLKALHDYNPILSDAEIADLLGINK